MPTIKEPSREIELKKSYDVIVAGGGVAGVASALSAAREGASVLLLERSYMLGGLATSGLVTIYLPLCDGEGRQVSYSIAEELLLESIKYGIEDKEPTPWLNGGTLEEKKKCRYEVRFNANMCAILYEQLLKKNGVDIMYGTSVCSVKVSRQKIKAVIVENKSGRYAYGCRSVVDCTGDADICKLSGEETSLFKQGNVLASWYYFVDKGKYDLCMLGFSDIPDKYKKNAEKEDNRRRYGGVDADELSEMTINAHENILQNYVEHHGKCDKDTAMASIATTPQIRMTRRLKGLYEIDDTEMHKFFKNSIGMVSDWRKPGPIYEMPFECLHGEKIKNLITAGRCISVTDDMWDVSRVIPVCAVTGEAAGLAAAMTDNFCNISITKLQKKLVNRGVILHEKDL